MKTYHILFKYDSTSRGENFVVEEKTNVVDVAPITAYILFRQKYPSNIFLGIYDLEAIGELAVNASAFKEAAEVDEVIRDNKENYTRNDAPF